MARRYLHVDPKLSIPKRVCFKVGNCEGLDLMRQVGRRAKIQRLDGLIGYCSVTPSTPYITYSDQRAFFAGGYVRPSLKVPTTKHSRRIGQQKRKTKGLLCFEGKNGCLVGELQNKNSSNNIMNNKIDFSKSMIY